MNPAYLWLPIAFPVFCGAILPKLHFPSKRMRNVYLMAVVLLNTVFTWVALLNPTDGIHVLFHFTDNLTFSVHMDSMSRIFAGLVATLWPFAMLYAFSYMEHDERSASFFMFYTMSFGVTLGIAFASDLLTLYCFYEMLTLMTVPLVMHSFTRKAVHAARKYLYYMLGGTAFAFIGLVFITVYGHTIDFIPGGGLIAAQAQSHEMLLQLVYVMTFCGFGAKAAIFPLHGWLPEASVAPTPVTALLHAVAVVKAGVFAIMRMTYCNFGADFLRGTYAQWICMALAIITIVYGSSLAVKETHFKRRLAYSTVSNLSYILFGVTLMTPAGLAAGMQHMVIHAVMKISLFFCAGAVIHVTEREYVPELDGMGRRMPLTFVFFTVAGLSLTGFPPFGGFISKWSLAEAAMDVPAVLPVIGVAALLLSALLTAIYVLNVSCRAFFPVRGRANVSAEIRDPDWRMMLPIALFAVLSLIIGLMAKPFTDMIAQIAAQMF